MDDLRLNEIEDLVQDSVFHPSPCRQLRERVLHDAVCARRRQTYMRRALALLCALSASVVIAVVVSRPTGATSRARPDEPSGDVQQSVESSRPAAPGSVVGGPKRSLGEELLRNAGPVQTPRD